MKPLECITVGCDAKLEVCTIAPVCPIRWGRLLAPLGIVIVVVAGVVGICVLTLAGHSELIGNLIGAVVMGIMVLRNEAGKATVEKTAAKVDELKVDLKANTLVCEEVRTITNGNSDKRATEAKAAGAAEERASIIATVASIAPEVVPTVVDKLPIVPK